MQQNDKEKETELERHLVEICTRKGLRMTGQRRTIAQVIARSDDHPNVEILHERVRKIDPSVSVATVYRTLRLLEDSGVISRLDLRDGSTRYEDNTAEDHHDHLIDVTSGEIIEFFDDELEMLQKKIAQRLGYRLVDHRMELYAVPVDSQE